MADHMETSYDADYKPPFNEGSSDSNRNMSRDAEKQHIPDSAPEYREHRRSSKYDRGDPFGDEEDSEVKYRTMAWWYV